MRSILMSTVKVRANEQESNSFELLQQVQPKLCDEVTNSQQSHRNSPPRLGGVPEGGGGRKTTNIQ